MIYASRGPVCLHAFYRTYLVKCILPNPVFQPRWPGIFLQYTRNICTHLWYCQFSLYLYNTLTHVIHGCVTGYGAPTQFSQSIDVIPEKNTAVEMHNSQNIHYNGRLFKRRSKKTSKLRVTGLCAGNSPVTGKFPAQMASIAENVSIWWRHHADCILPRNWNNIMPNRIAYKERSCQRVESRVHDLIWYNVHSFRLSRTQSQLSVYQPRSSCDRITFWPPSIRYTTEINLSQHWKYCISRCYILMSCQ